MIKVGHRFSTENGSIYKVKSISENMRVLTCLNEETGKVAKFIFYNASGKYINGTQSWDKTL